MNAAATQALDRASLIGKRKAGLQKLVSLFIQDNGIAEGDQSGALLIKEHALMRLLAEAAIEFEKGTFGVLATLDPRILGPGSLTKMGERSKDVWEGVIKELE